MPTDLPHVGLLLLIAALVTILSRRLRVPYAIGLVLAGLAIGWLDVPLQLTLSKELVFGLFLPPLVFEAALQIHWPELRRDLPLIGLLATLGVLLAATLTALGMAWLAGWSLPSALVFGTLIAATDPVSVIATFKDAGVTGRLRLLIEAESLLNDGTAAVGVAIAVAYAAGASSGALAIGLALGRSIGGGVLCGLGAGALLLLARRAREPLVEITLTTAAAYGSFWLAEHYHLSGILAALAAGLVAGNSKSIRRSGDTGRAVIESYWQYVAFAANSMIFLLMGGHAARAMPTLWRPALLAIVLVTAGRAVTIYPLCALWSGSAQRVEIRHQHVLFWGGLRGALALALALGLPPELAYREAIVTTTFAVVIWSILAQGLSITPLMRRLGLLGPREAP